MSKTIKPVGYQIYRSESNSFSNQYAKLTISLLSVEEGEENRIEFHWQGNLTGDLWGIWYGFAMEAKTTSASHMVYIANLVKRIFNVDMPYDHPPKLILERLEALKIERITYDNRTHRYIPLRELDGDKRELYRASRVLGWSWIPCEVLALNEEDAKKKLRVELAQRNDSKELLQEFLIGGEPVEKVDRYNEIPEPLDSLLSLPKKAKEEEPQTEEVLAA